MASLSTLTYRPTANALVKSTANDSAAPAARRWVRGGFETCVSGVHRNPRLLSHYTAQYKFSDPQWRPLLQLPCGNPIALELRARHVNVGLRHLVQRGHAVFIVEWTKHSVFHPRGLAERAFVTTSMGKVNERLLTEVIHEGPLDAANPHGPRGVVGMSLAHGYAGPFVRRTMLWKRSRRVGAMQGQLGAYEWEAYHPAEVGRPSAEDSMLLKPHTRFLGGSVATTGIVSSDSISRHRFHYVNEFEAPAPTAIDAVHQAAYLAATHHALVEPQEPLHCVGWTMKSEEPWPPLELDLPFKAQIGKPAVHTDASTYPSTNLGSPFVAGAPVVQLDWTLRQGNPAYIYDQGPAFRPLNWWSQMDMTPYMGHMYCVRDGNVDKLRPVEEIMDPFATPEATKGISPDPTRAPGAARSAPGGVAQERMRKATAAAAKKQTASKAAVKGAKETAKTPAKGATKAAAKKAPAKKAKGAKA